MSDISIWHPLIGTLGATIANITGIGGGVVFFPYLVSITGDEQTALINSVYIQIVGMGMGSLLWYLKEGLSRTFCSDLIKIVVSGYCGMLFGNHFLKLDKDSLMILFSLATIGLSIASLLVRIEKPVIQYEKSGAKNSAIENCLIFISGAVTSQISIGFGECVMLIKYLRIRQFKYAVRLAVSGSAALLALYALSIDTSPTFNLAAPIAIGTLPGAAIGFIMTSNTRYQKTVKTTVFSLLIGFGSVHLLSKLVAI